MGDKVKDIRNSDPTEIVFIQNKPGLSEANKILEEFCGTVILFKGHIISLPPGLTAPRLTEGGV